MNPDATLINVLGLVLTCLLVLSPLAVHEIGHWAVLKRYHVPVVQYWLGVGPAILRLGSFRMGMLPIGGAVVPQPQAYARLLPMQRVAVALAGPLISLVYALALYAAYLWLPEKHAWTALPTLAGLSAFLAVVNLMPVPPLDGFHALAAWREHRNNPFSPQLLAFANRVGSGFVYGVGFFVLASVFIK